MMIRFRKFILQRRTFLALLLFSILFVCLAVFVTCQPRDLIPSALLTLTLTLTRVPTDTPVIPTVTATLANTDTPTATLTPTLQASDTPTLTFTATPTPTLENTPSVTPTVIDTVTPWRNGTMPTTGAPSASNAWLVIFGTVLLALGAWLFDASAQLPHTVGADE